VMKTNRVAHSSVRSNTSSLVDPKIELFRSEH
jgi:hypothetical protein